ncbi:hypothetical protein [Chromobacterium haemolyticum]|uniref:hypothetical protein n=1 Tax=Chromobacterium haemolyticum TaxID=394935 RepID=UPI0012DE92B9|nr:hypothetical protein [Chromobacterium haemolyticum]
MFENEQKYFKTNNIWLFSNMFMAFKRLFFMQSYDFKGDCLCCLSRKLGGRWSITGNKGGAAGS